MAKQPTNVLSSFEQQIKWALKQYDAPELLGKESPLASYYLLGHLLTEIPNAASAITRGNLLRRELQNAAELLWSDAPITDRDELVHYLQKLSKEPESDSYAYLILELRCFQRFLQPKRVSEIWEQILPGSRAEHYRDYDRAIAKLARAFLQRVQPTFRLEQPPVIPNLLGYDAFTEEAKALLAAHKTVAIYGPGGVGKSTLAATIAATYAVDHCFWFTIRPTLNDRLESLLFALGYFLHQQGTSNLWHMLLINNGKVDNLAMAFGLVHEDLTAIDDRPLLFCIDELEHLQVSDPEQSNPTHQQIIHFLESLQGHTSLLLLSQRPLFAADHYIKLRGLIAPDVARFFAQGGIDLSMVMVEHLLQHTGGNPRLLSFYRLLCQKGETLEILLAEQTPRPELYPLLQRLWQRMAPKERHLVQALSVFRGVVPAEQWEGNREVIDRLVAQGLLHWNSPGAIALISALRTAVYQELTPEQRESLHAQAAAIRSDRAEYTAAAYHLCRSGAEAAAIRLWYQYMAQEIQRGQAGAALALFSQISGRQLDGTHRSYLTIIRAELQFLRGNVGQGLALLTEDDWQEPSPLAVRALGLQGKFQQELGQLDAAVASYQQAEAHVYHLLEQVTDFHYQAGVAYLRDQNKVHARREADLAYYHAYCLDGNVREAEGEYDAAHAAYQQALRLAERVDDAAHTARVHRLLARLYIRQQKFDAAILQANLAIGHYETMGDRINQEIMRNLMGSIYLETGAYQTVVELLVPTIAFFRRVNHSHFVAAAAANLAEAHLKLGELVQAETYALEVLHLEEPYTYSHAHYTLGLVHHTRHDSATAEQHLQEAARYAQTNGDPYWEAYAQHALATIYAQQQRHVISQQAATAAATLAQQLGIHLQTI